MNANEHFATLMFFDDPSVILNNTQRPLPAGLPDAGDRPAVAAGQRRGDQWRGLPVDTTTDVRQFGTWFQDDWRATSNLTLNLGVRYDIDFNLMDQENHHAERDAHALEAIGNPYGGFPDRRS